LQADIPLDARQLQTVMFLQLAVGGHLLLFVVRTKLFLFEPPYPNARLFWAIVATQIAALLICCTGLGVPGYSCGGHRRSVGLLSRLDDHS
jgi:H+-transporting ATPase